jgi:glycosyltransferase involved in cell wall biosynthesis
VVSRPPHLLFVVASDVPNERAGVVQQLKTAAALARAGVEVCLVAKQSQSSADVAQVLALYGLPADPALQLDLVRVRPGRARYREFFARLVTRPSWWKHNALLTREPRIVMLSRLTRPTRKILFEAHDLADVPERVQNRRTRIVQRLALRWATAVVTVTHSGAERIHHAGVERSRLLVAPDAADAEACASETRVEPRRIGYVGSLYADRGCDLIIEALAFLPEMHAEIVGGPADRIADLERQAAALGVAERLTLPGPIPHTDVARALQRAAVLVLPMRSGTAGDVYASPMKLFEYMAAERPIVAADLPTIREIVDERHVFFFEPGNARSLAEQVALVVAEPAAAARRSRAAAQLLRADYTYDARAQRVVKFATGLRMLQVR